MIDQLVLEILDEIFFLLGLILSKLCITDTLFTLTNAGGQYGGHTGYSANDASGSYPFQNTYNNGFGIPQVYFFFTLTFG